MNPALPSRYTATAARVDYRGRPILVWPPGKSPERDLMGIIKLIVEQADSLFLMNQKRKI